MSPMRFPLIRSKSASPQPLSRNIRELYSPRSLRELRSPSPQRNYDAFRIENNQGSESISFNPYSVDSTSELESIMNRDHGTVQDEETYFNGYNHGLFAGEESNEENNEFEQQGTANLNTYNHEDYSDGAETFHESLIEEEEQSDHPYACVCYRCDIYSSPAEEDSELAYLEPENQELILSLERESLPSSDPELATERLESTLSTLFSEREGSFLSNTVSGGLGSTYGFNWRTGDTSVVEQYEAALKYLEASPSRSSASDTDSSSLLKRRYSQTDEYAADGESDSHTSETEEYDADDESDFYTSETEEYDADDESDCEYQFSPLTWFAEAELQPKELQLEPSDETLSMLEELVQSVKYQKNSEDSDISGNSYNADNSDNTGKLFCC